MTDKMVDLSLGRFRFVNGTPNSYKARVSYTSEQDPTPSPTNTKYFGDADLVMGPGDTAEADEAGQFPAGTTFVMWFQDQSNQQWYQGTHLNQNDGISAAFVVFGGGSSPSAEVLLALEGQPTMAGAMSCAPTNTVPPTPASS